MPKNRKGLNSLLAKALKKLLYINAGNIQMMAAKISTQKITKEPGKINAWLFCN
jgi:hypothetical protein